MQNNYQRPAFNFQNVKLSEVSVPPPARLSFLLFLVTSGKKNDVFLVLQILLPAGCPWSCCTAVTKPILF